MTKSELISKLSDLEWEDFEVKEARGEVPKSAWPTVSAFSNTAGGWLVVGVKQSGKSFVIQGLSNPEKIEQDFLNAIRSGKFNVFIPTQQMRYDVEGKKVIAFYIPVSAQKPVYFNTLSNTYIRRGSSDQKATKEEIDAMFRYQTFGTKTSELVSGTSDKDIEQASLQQYREYMSRLSIPRNPILAKFFRMVRIAENAGYGFDKMESNWKEYNQTNPEYEIDFNSVIVIFNLESQSKDPSEVIPDSLEDILKIIRDDILHNNASPEFIQSTLRDNYGLFTG